MVEFSIANFVNVVAFLGLTVATYTIFYFGRAINPKGFSINLFTLALGINLIGLSHLFRIWLDPPTSPIITLTVASGAIFTATGVIWAFYEHGMEISTLKRRQEEIKSIIAKLKEKYYKQEISENELEDAYSNLLEELTEIEVKLREVKKKKNIKS